MIASAQTRSVSVGKALGLAALVGVLAGVVMARTQRPPDDFDMQEAENLAAQAMPTGAPPVARPEAPRAAAAEDMMAPDPRSLRGLPPYPGAPTPRRMISSHPGADQTLAISWFQTGDSVEEVLGYYERSFADANLLYTSYRYGPKRGYVSWFEHDYTGEPAGVPKFGAGVMHMVTATTEGENTTVMLSATEPQKILENLAPLPAGLRIPPGSVPQVINMSELGQQRVTIIATYEQSGDRLIEALEGLWREDGWKVVERSEEEGARHLTVAVNGRQQSVVIESRGERSQLLITVEERPTSPGATP